MFLPESLCVYVYFSKYLGRRPGNSLRALKGKDNLISELIDH